MPTLTSVTWSCSQMGFCSSVLVVLELEMVVVVVVLLARFVLMNDIGAEEVVAQAVAGCLFLIVVGIGHRKFAP